MSQSKSTASASLKLFQVVATIFLTASAIVAQTPTPTASPTPRRVTARPFPPAQYIPPHDYDQQNIKLDLRFDFQKEQAVGIETITLTPTVKDLQRVDLDAAFMTFESAKLAQGASLKFEVDADKQKLAIMLDRAYQPGERSRSSLPITLTNRHRNARHWPVAAD